MSGRGGRRGGRRGGAEGTAVPTVTIMTAAGERVQGTLVAIDDFLVTVALPDGSIRSYRRDGKVPRVDVHDPLDGHRALLRTLTNTDMHNVTAFLVTLK
jgi:cytochrome c oxidase cbb3-type subunit 3